MVGVPEPPRQTPPAPPPVPISRPLADVLRELRCVAAFRFNNRFRRRLAVLKRDPAAAPPPEARPGVAVRAFGPGGDLPPDVETGLADRFGGDFPAVHAAERAGGSTLYVGFLDDEDGPGAPAGFVRTKPGGRVSAWHEALGPDDRLVYALATHRPCRGRGVSTAVVRAALADVPAGGAAWADTMVWNGAALAVLRKAGFRTLYEAPPLPDHPD